MRSLRKRDAAVEGKAHSRHVALLDSVFNQLFETFPNGDYVWVVVSRAHTFGLPRHDLDVHGRIIGTAEHNRRIVGDETQPAQRRPMTREQV
jgi:hypothetical protein